MVTVAMKQRADKAKRHLKRTRHPITTPTACKEAISFPATDLDIQKTSVCGVQSACLPKSL